MTKLQSSHRSAGDNNKTISIRITDEINVDEAYKMLLDSKSGGISLLIATVRNENDDKEVEKLFFDAYDEMALLEMGKIAAFAKKHFVLNRAIMWHVKGTKTISEPVVLTGASSKHRQQAMEASAYMIAMLKQTVPIWKKEYYKDGEVWINVIP